MEYGKFKDATSLLEGYLNLEKAYTKKCQEANKLKAEIEAQVQASSTQSGAEEVENKTSFMATENCEALGVEEEKCESMRGFQNEAFVMDASKAIASLESEPLTDDSQKTFEGEEIAENVSLENDANVLDEKQVADEALLSEPKEVREKLFKSPRWRKDVAEFFAKNKEARAFKKEIARLIMNDSDLAFSENALFDAFERVKNKRPASTFDGQEGYIEQPKQSALVNSNNAQDLSRQGESEAEKMTLSDYLLAVAEKKASSPRFFSPKSSGGTVGLGKSQKISSLSEAKDFLLKNYFS